MFRCYCDATSRKNCLKLFPNIFSVENFNPSNFPVHHVKNQHPFFGCQGDIPMAGTVGTLGLWLRVKRGAEVVPAAATVENCRTGDLGGQLGFALLFEKVSKLGCERREHIGEKQLGFVRLVHGHPLLCVRKSNFGATFEQHKEGSELGSATEATGRTLGLSSWSIGAFREGMSDPKRNLNNDLDFPSSALQAGGLGFESPRAYHIFQVRPGDMGDTLYRLHG
jgi:hypothetical protein